MSLRDCLTRLEKEGDLIRIRREVDRTFERDPIQDVYDYITKIGIDATKPLARADRFELAKIPGYETIDLKDYLG